jgi:hypothetical protein
MRYGLRIQVIAELLIEFFFLDLILLLFFMIFIFNQNNHIH